LPSPSDLPELERERERMYSDLRDIGDFRPGTLNAVRHKWGKPHCACEDPNHPGHGEEYILAKKVAGKKVATHFRPGPALDKSGRDVANYKRFRGLGQAMVEITEQIHAPKPAASLAPDQPPAERKTGGSSCGFKRTARPTHGGSASSAIPPRKVCSPWGWFFAPPGSSLEGGCWDSTLGIVVLR